MSPRRRASLSWKHFALSAALLFSLLLVAKAIYRSEPTRIRVVVGAKKVLPFRGDDYKTISEPGDRLRVERDRKGRLLLFGKRAGAASLQIFKDGHLTRRYEVEVLPRKIQVATKRITPKELKQILERAKRARARRKRRQAKRKPPVLRPIPLVADRKVPPPPEKTPEKAKKKAKKPEPKKKQPKKLAQRKPPPPPPPRKKMVELDQANKKKPLKANYLAQEDSAVDRETRARRTTLIKTKPGKTQPDRDRGRKRVGDRKPIVAQDRDQDPRRFKRKIAMAPQTIAPRPRPEPEPELLPVPSTEPRRKLAERGRKVRDTTKPHGPRRPFQLYPSPAVIAQVLREHPGRPASAGQQGRRQMRATRMPGGRWRRIFARVRGFMENFIPEVRPGEFNSLNTQKHAFAAYIARAHRRLHVEWGYGIWQNFRDLPDPGGYNPMRSSIQARLEIKLDRRGRVKRLAIVRTSGYSTFDAGAMASVLAAAPFGRPPPEMISRDGITYLHWNFYQDGRQCWTNDVQIFVNGS